MLDVLNGKACRAALIVPAEISIEFDYVVRALILEQ